ncbi:MAG: FHA domain-containing protein [Candidatus Nanopelagicales bacterium]
MTVQSNDFDETTGEANVATGDAPILIRCEGVQRRVNSAEAITFGRAEGCDVVVADLQVSRRHAVLFWRDGWIVRDLTSANGTFVNGHPITEVSVPGLGEETRVRFGDPVDGPEIVLVVEAQHRPAAEVPVSEYLETRVFRSRVGQAVVLGRGADSDIVLADPLVSRSHCRVVQTAAALVVTDLQSSHGTYINGSRIVESVLSPGDTLTVGNTDIDVDGSSQLVVRSDATRTGLVIRDLSYETPEGKRLISDINLNAPRGSLIGVIGPSGAGKSTLMNVITGLRQPTQGTASFEGHDIHGAYTFMKTRIGFVPQEDLIHRQLSARQALGFAADLRFSPDVSRAERDARVNEVVDLLGLREHEKTPIEKLSGGQRKRASIGLELLTEPALLVLDEPTSGLDPNTARDLMRTLRALADAGHTVVVVSHAPADLDECDLVVLLAAGGLLAGVGSPDLVLSQFNTDDWRDVYRDVSSEGGDPAAAHARYAQAAVGVAVSDPPPPPRQAPAIDAASGSLRPKQLGTLVRRQFRLLTADRGYLIFLLLLPIALGALALIVPGSDGFAPSVVDPVSKEVPQILVVLICGASFAGLALSIRDLVGERRIFERERAVGLRPTAYLASKVAVFAVVGVVQAVALTGVVLVGKSGPTEPLVLPNASLELFCAVLFTLWCSCALGLMLSSLVRSNEQVMPVLVLVIMVQLVFSGGMIQITGRPVLSQISFLFPSRWGYSAASATTDLHRLAPAVTRDALWDHSTFQWLVACLALLVLGAAFLAITRWRLRVPHPRGPRRRSA